MAQIIPKNPIQVEPHWQKEIAQSFTDPEELLNYLDLDPNDFAAHLEARRLFPMRVPRPFANKMQPQNPADPLLMQVFPLADEFLSHADFTPDPLLEHDTAGKGVLHKYASRALFIVKGGCAVNCRYCFRRHFPYQENSNRRHEWQDALEYVQSQPDINEIIFSGGDPLMANDNFLTWLANEVLGNANIKRLRIHTRLPVVIPSRIDNGFIDWFGNLPVQKILVLHINHANEIDDTLQKKCEQLTQAGVTLLNQAVLLKGINDNAETQIDLSERLFEAGIMPYYLHVLDKVQGAAHFNVDDQYARTIMHQMLTKLPGFLVPRLVREIGGEASKTPLDLRLHP